MPKKPNKTAAKRTNPKRKTRAVAKREVQNFVDGLVDEYGARFFVSLARDKAGTEKDALVFQKKLANDRANADLKGAFKALAAFARRNKYLFFTNVHRFIGSKMAYRLLGFKDNKDRRYKYSLVR